MEPTLSAIGFRDAEGGESSCESTADLCSPISLPAFTVRPCLPRGVVVVRVAPLTKDKAASACKIL